MSKGYLVVGGDIGGTNSRLKLYEVKEKDIGLTEGLRPPGAEVFASHYENHKFATFGLILNAFIQEALGKVGNGYTVKDIVSACIAVAGPVADNTVTFTNRGEWVIRGEDLARGTGIKRVLLVNDFQALGYGLLTVDTSENSKEVVVLQKGEPKKKAPIACIGAGTGLGEVYLTVDNGHYVAYPSEGGHAEFPPRTDLEFEMLSYLKTKYQAKHRVSVERVISGPGLANVYEFLAQAEPDKVDKAIHDEFEKAGDYKGRVVAVNAAKKPTSLCGRAMDIFVAAYGSEAGVAGLKWMPFGGLYIAGGLTPKNIDRIKPDKDGHSLFLDAYYDKGRVSPFLKKIPLYAVLVEDLGERGAHWVAIKLLLEEMGRSQNEELDGFRALLKTTHGTVALGWALSMTAVALAFAFGRR